MNQINKKLQEVNAKLREENELYKNEARYYKKIADENFEQSSILTKKLNSIESDIDRARSNPLNSNHQTIAPRPKNQQIKLATQKVTKQNISSVARKKHLENAGTKHTVLSNENVIEEAPLPQRIQVQPFQEEICLPSFM